jgi:uncharacterized membrane protein
VRIDPQVLLTILGMALVTYATRAGGLLLMSRVTLSPGVEAWLRNIPGAVLVSLVAPTVLAGGAPEALGSAATVLVALRTRNLPLAMVAGVGVVWAMRQIL